MSDGIVTAPERPTGRARHRLAFAVMGVSGSGKTTLGQAIAAHLGLAFVDGDDLHPAANVAKMAAGTPLDDVDRWPWLDRVGATLDDIESTPAGVVVACSALRRIYRDRIRAAAAGDSLHFVYLQADEAEMVLRLKARPHHYMPASLVSSQFATLEAPDPAEEQDVLVLPATGQVGDKVTAVMDWIASPGFTKA